jgi:hypothetical protein
MTPRAALLHDAADLAGRHDAMYGDPLANFSAAAQLKELFWRHFDHATFATLPPIRLDDEGTNALPEAISGSCQPAPREAAFGRNTPHGHAIDMIFQNLAQIATSPDPLMDASFHTEIATYAALAYEVAKRT